MNMMNRKGHGLSILNIMFILSNKTLVHSHPTSFVASLLRIKCGALDPLQPRPPELPQPRLGRGEVSPQREHRRGAQRAGEDEPAGGGVLPRHDEVVPYGAG